MDAEWLSISEFARLSSIKRKNLIFYDEIGLFSPARKTGNGYRYYTYGQLDIANLIWSLKEIGVPLKEIKCYIDERSPERMLALFAQQRENIEREIYKLTQIRSMMDVYTDATRSVQGVVPGQLELCEYDAEPVAYGPVIDYSDGRTIPEALADFYEYALCAGFVCSYPLGSVIRGEHLCDTLDLRPDRFYYRMPDGPDIIPPGLYVRGHDYGDYGQTHRLYASILEFIRAHDLVICGDSYEEYILNEITTKNVDEYMCRVTVHVQRR